MTYSKNIIKKAPPIRSKKMQQLSRTKGISKSRVTDVTLRDIIAKSKYLKGNIKSALDDFLFIRGVNQRFNDVDLNIGICLRMLGREQESIAYLKNAVLVEKESVDAWNECGDVYFKLNQLEKAEYCFKKSTVLKRADYEAFLKLGKVYYRKKNYSVALHYFISVFKNNIRSLDKNNFYSLLNYVGQCYFKLSDYSKALQFLNKAIDLIGTLPDAYFNKGQVLATMSKLDISESYYAKAVELDPNNIEYLACLGGLYTAQKRYIEGFQVLEKANQLPNGNEQWKYVFEIEKCMMELGAYDVSCSQYYKDSKQEGYLGDSKHNRLFFLNYDPYKSLKEIFYSYKAFAEKNYPFDKPDKKSYQTRESVPNRKIRVGYISPDFNNHACYNFYNALLKYCNDQKFELYAYSNTRQADLVTSVLKERFYKWTDIVEMDAERTAQSILADGIDILIDLAGHTSGNRLDVLALKPAQIQATYLGYGYTTGMTQIDYFFGDQNFTPAGCDAYFSEEIVRLDRPAFCYLPEGLTTPDVNELPYSNNGYITFGTLSRLVRLNQYVLKTWAEILKRIPNSKLIIDQKAFKSEKTKSWYKKRLAGFGIDIERVELRASQYHWDTYKDIDISLDAFPHNSGTTLFESLWMGVPPLSKVDRPSVGRFGACILKPLGLDEWLTTSEEDYIKRAVEMSSKMDELSNLRASLRGKLQNSPFMDGPSFTRHFENALLEMINKRL